MYWVGNVAGVVFIASISDRFGRKVSMFIGSVICLVGVGLSTGSSTAGMFIGGRLLLGIGGVIIGAIGPVYMTELAYPNHRATATALSNTTYSTGSIFSAWITFGSFRLTSQWFVGLQAVPVPPTYHLQGLENPQHLPSTSLCSDIDRSPGFARVSATKEEL